MRKLLSSLFILVLLAGCTQADDTNTKKEQAKKEKQEVVKDNLDVKQCSIDSNINDLNIDIELQSKDDAIKKVLFTSVIDNIYTYMGVDEETMTDDLKNVLKQQLLSELEINKNTRGITYDPVFEGSKLTFTLTLDMDEADKEFKENIDERKDNLSLTNTLEKLEIAGYQCK